MISEAIARLDWDKGDGLLPAVVQNADTLQVLMLGYMNRRALEVTLDSKSITFFSRSKKRLWTKGESSGNRLELVSHHFDCDLDALLFRVRPVGPTCHRGTTSCFEQSAAPGLGFLGELEGIIAERERARPEGSYVGSLFARGLDRIIQKVGEEAVETVIAAKNPERDPLVNEASDLLFHLLVLLRARGLSLSDLVAVLRERHRPPK